MSTLSFTFRHEHYKALKSRKISPETFMKEILEENDGYLNVNRRNYMSVISALRSYHDFEGGAPEIDDLDIVNVQYDYLTRNGKVEITYWVFRLYGGNKQHSGADFSAILNFAIDITTKHVNIELPI